MLLTWGSLQLAGTWVGSWRSQIGLPHDQGFELWSIGWLLVGVYVSYALGLLYSRWQLRTDAQPDR